MNTLTKNPISKRVAVLSASAIALCNAISGIIQLTDEQSSQTTVVGIEHVTITCFAAMVLLLIPTMFYFAGITGRRTGAWITTAGSLILAALATSSNIRGEDYGFFAAVAVPTNLAITIGLIVTAVALRKRTNAPLALVIALPLMWFVALPLSSLGGGLLVAAFWVALAWMFEHDRIVPVARNNSSRLTSTQPAPAAA